MTDAHARWDGRCDRCRDKARVLDLEVESFRCDRCIAGEALDVHWYLVESTTRRSGSVLAELRDGSLHVIQHQEALTASDLITRARQLPSRWDRWVETPLSDDRPQGTCTICGVTVNLYSILNGSVGFMDGHLRPDGERCVFSFTTSHDNGALNGHGQHG